MKKSSSTRIIVLCAVTGLLWIGIRAWAEGRYNLVMILLVCVSTIPFYMRYEHRKPHAREVVVLSVMIALTVLSRVVFAALPGFKPVMAIVILCGMAFGSEAGFLCGSLSAFISNMFFGQGPWTPFQMIALGMIGLGAGTGMLKNRLVLMVYGILSGILYSMFMDIWTVLSIDQTFRWNRYLAVLVPAVPFMVTYAVSNVVFLGILTPLLLKKMQRIRKKYGFDVKE